MFIPAQVCGSVLFRPDTLAYVFSQHLLESDTCIYWTRPVELRKAPKVPSLPLVIPQQSQSLSASCLSVPSSDATRASVPSFNMSI